MFSFAYLLNGYINKYGSFVTKEKASLPKKPPLSTRSIKIYWTAKVHLHWHFCDQVIILSSVFKKIKQKGSWSLKNDHDTFELRAFLEISLEIFIMWLITYSHVMMRKGPLWHIPVSNMHLNKYINMYLFIEQKCFQSYLDVNNVYKFL